jgi:hypothetical protein
VDRKRKYVKRSDRGTNKEEIGMNIRKEHREKLGGKWGKKSGRKLRRKTGNNFGEANKAGRQSRKNGERAKKVQEERR